MKKILALLPVLLILLLTDSTAGAKSPYNTWAPGPGGGLYFSQDAYIPVAEVDLPISAAEDMVVTSDGSIFIADTGNARILKLREMKVAASYGEGILKGPTGLFVDETGNMYIADGKQDAIVILDNEGNLIRQFGRPTEALFGETKEFLPRKIAVDARQNIYIISEGSANGIVQMNTNGNFIGYFGANTAQMSLKMILQRLFLTKEQLAQFIKNQAASPSNIAIDNESLVYTITAGTARTKSIRKFNITGKNVFPDAWGSLNFRDINVSEDGLIVAVDGFGRIYEYDVNGTLLFVFGAMDSGDQRLGTLLYPTGIDRYQEYLYVLDRDKDVLVVYETTAFARLVHDGVRYYKDGFYREARPYFEKVITYNGSFIMSYRAIADAYYKDREYASALAYYRYGEDRNGYSQAFWELRNLILQDYLGTALLVLGGVWVSGRVFKRLDRRYEWTAPIRNAFRSLRRFKWVDDFIFMFRFIKQPADSFYYIKKNQRGSLGFAIFVYFLVVLIRVVSLYVTGFAFSPYPSPAYIYVENEISVTFLLILLWNAANYLVSTISDGEGRVRDVVIGSAYSLFPYVLFALPIALVSNMLTLNEIFIYRFSMQIMIFWVGLMLFLMVKEVHNYSISETIRNILTTLFTMTLFVLTGYILYVLFNQLYDFVSAILQEVRLRG